MFLSRGVVWLWEVEVGKVVLDGAKDVLRLEGEEQAARIFQ
ncbi:MAG TPA: hypothetical protein VNG51_29070 [Ktedonobacteraceae bacterium]|nr:hypothetical protein [Ktedonobacteraceae bacterium]